jgi:hypothetical protein
LHLAFLASQATIPDIDFHRPMTTQTDDKLGTERSSGGERSRSGGHRSRVRARSAA